VLQRVPERLERLPGVIGRRPLPVARREVDFLVQRDRRERIIEIRWLHARIAEVEHQRIACRQPLRHVVAPGPAAKDRVLDLVELGKAW
jgi:hypothetical protein